MIYNPRRNRQDLMHPAEKAATEAIIAIEKIPADEEVRYTVDEVKSLFNEWLDETKRNGSVLVRGSIYEFFAYLAGAKRNK